VASGLSNKQVAEQLYVSIYTVEGHLSQAYAKLGIGSRTQLARALGPRR
jgi:DNA-binding NarL/FixJ family response regulator